MYWSYPSNVGRRKIYTESIFKRIGESEEKEAGGLQKSIREEELES